MLLVLALCDLHNFIKKNIQAEEKEVELERKETLKDTVSSNDEGYIPESSTTTAMDIEWDEITEAM